MSCPPQSTVLPSITPSISSWRISLQPLGVLSFIAFQRFHLRRHHFGVHGTNQATFLINQNHHQNDASDFHKCFVKACEMQLVQRLSETMICEKEQGKRISQHVETWWNLALPCKRLDPTTLPSLFPRKELDAPLEICTWALGRFLKQSPYSDDSCA